jgi:serine/threonine protein kinase/tetratricopeptide (TPR) repeat protein
VIENLTFDGGRYEARSELGAGGCGVVYEAWDTQRRELIALKTLLTPDPAAIYRFKQEFRTVADLSHPNLALLHELIHDGNEWFLTMELVPGRDFCSWVRYAIDPSDKDPGPDNGEPGLGESVGPGAQPGRMDTDTGKATATAGRRDPPGATLDLARLRDALRQLAEGVHALHQAGIVHRDLKPTNVLVTDEGRVAILDFGLAQHLKSDGDDDDGGLSGTIPYMSPEQTDSKGVNPPTDWYAVGVMLFEALTGEYPYLGSAIQMLMAKKLNEPVDPRQRVPEGTVPDDLADLCLDLMAKEPANRPTGEEVLERLGVQTRDTLQSVAGFDDDPELVGREELLADLRRAAARARQGHGTSVYVHGASGMGKSALIRHFLDELHESGDAVLLRARCYERETVPFKALDGAIDSLSRHLRANDDLLLPDGIHALARVFPVLKSVPGISALPEQTAEIANAAELRHRAFTTLRQLFSELCARNLVVLHVDDLQWADADSDELLADLLGGDDPPPLLLLASFRSEEIEKRPVLQRLLATTDGHACREMVVGPLPDGDARQLAAAILEDAKPEHVSMIVAEAEGSPFFVEQLARFSASNPHGLEGGLGLAEMLQRQVAGLPRPATHLLHVLAVTGRPIRMRIAKRAAGIDGDERPILARLRSAHLVRTSDAGEQCEMYHDRLREALASTLEDKPVRSVHAALVDAYRHEGIDDPDALFIHHLGAGQRELAAEQAVRAARRADHALAFERAAELYRQALALLPPDTKQRVHLLDCLGDALSNAGRGGEGAQAYLRAAQHSSGDRAFELRRKATEQFLSCGHMDDGIRVMYDLLPQVRRQLARPQWMTVAGLLLQRGQLHLRGFDFQPETITDPEGARRVDSLWTVTVGLSLVNPIRAAYFAPKGLRESLDLGEPYRSSRGLSLHIMGLCTSGRATPAKFQRAKELHAQAVELAERSGHPHAIGLAHLAEAYIEWSWGRWTAADALCRRAELELRERCRGVNYELGLTALVRCTCLWEQGLLKELGTYREALLKRAQAVDNAFLTNYLKSALARSVWLARDEVERARNDNREAIEGWTGTGVQVQHFWEMWSNVCILLYQGDPLAALEPLRERVPKLRRNLLMTTLRLRIPVFETSARTALLAAGMVDGRRRTRLLSMARRNIERLHREALPDVHARARLLEAGWLYQCGQQGPAVEVLAEAERRCETSGLGLLAAAARHQRGCVLGGREGEALIESAAVWMREQIVKRPAVMADMFAPGFGRSEDTEEPKSRR